MLALKSSYLSYSISPIKVFKLIQENIMVILPFKKQSSTSKFKNEYGIMNYGTMSRFIISANEIACRHNL